MKTTTITGRLAEAPKFSHNVGGGQFTAKLNLYKAEDFALDHHKNLRPIAGVVPVKVTAMGIPAEACRVANLQEGHKLTITGELFTDSNEMTAMSIIVHQPGE